MESGTSLCLIVYFLVCSSEAQKNITAEVGQDVILPCKAPNNINIRAVKWSRPDQDPDHVLFYRDGLFDTENQHPSYQNRVDLKDKDMKDGNFSLVLKNVMMEDTGRYECRVFEEGKIELISIIILVVRPPAQENMEAEVGKDVILPCKVPNNNNIRAVEWTRPDQDPDQILYYWNGHFVPENQHPSYQNRVDLQDKEMKDGNFSLVLKNVMKNDTGRYECWVSQRNKFEPINVIDLVVHGEKFERDQDGIIRDGGNKTGIIVGSVVGVILLLLAVLVSVGFLIYRRHMMKNPNLPVPLDEQLNRC